MCDVWTNYLYFCNAITVTDEVTMKKLEPEIQMVRKIARGASARVFEGVIRATGEVTQISTPAPCSYVKR